MLTRLPMSPVQFSRSMFALACLLWPALALAHIGQGDISGGFIAGVAHPVFGLDHVVAMVAVGGAAAWVAP